MPLLFAGMLRQPALTCGTPCSAAVQTVWKAALEAQQLRRRERQQQAGGQRQGSAAAAAAAQQRQQDKKLLLQSPQARAGHDLAVGGRRLSALGTSGGECV